MSAKRSLWRVPLIALITGALYTPCYVRIVLRFGVIEPGMIDDRAAPLTSGALLLLTLVLGWAILLRKQTRKEILLSSSIVVVYGLLLWLVQFLSGSTTGPAAVLFLHTIEMDDFPNSTRVVSAGTTRCDRSLVRILPLFCSPAVRPVWPKKAGLIR